MTGTVFEQERVYNRGQRRQLQGRCGRFRGLNGTTVFHTGYCDAVRHRQSKSVLFSKHPACYGLPIFTLPDSVSRMCLGSSTAKARR